MIYVMSDIHGRDDLFKIMLKKIKFDENKDFLYILGDTVDRGGDMTALFLIKSMVERGCCKLIMGNHELSLSFALDSYINPDDLVKRVNEKMLNDLRRKMNQKNGTNNLFSILNKLVSSVHSLSFDTKLYDDIKSNITLTNIMHGCGLGRNLEMLQKLSKSEINELNNFIKNLPAMQELNLNGKKYILVHGGYNSDNRNDVNFLTTAREKFYLNDIGESNTIVVFGHTTTMNIKAEKYGKIEIPYTIWFDESGDKVGIDCGAAYPHGQLACLCLDDMTEYYVTNDRNMIMPLDYRNQQMKTLQNFEREIHRKYPYADSIIINGNSINQKLFS